MQTATASVLRALKMLHPSGQAGRICTIGSRFNPGAFGISRLRTGDAADLIVVAPTRSECATRGWLAHAAHAADVALSRHGVVHGLIPRPWRQRWIAEVSRRGFRVFAPMLHFPAPLQEACLASVGRPSLTYAVGHVLPMSDKKQRIALAVLSAPWALRVLPFVLKNIGICAYRAAGVSPFDWLTGGRPSGVVVRPSWRGPDETIVALSFEPLQPAPSRVAKMTRSERRCSEARRLQELGPGAERAGARVPKVILERATDDQNLVIETGLAGTTAASLLRRRPDLLSTMLKDLSAWLTRWAAATRRMIRPRLDDLGCEASHLVAAVLPEHPEAASYQRWLADRCSKLAGATVPTVAAHNDLTMWNVLHDEELGLAVVDWESSERDGLPFSDFTYAVSNAVFAAGGCSDLSAAFAQCFTPKGVHFHLVSGMARELACATQCPSDWLELAAHLSWLRHAGNELSRPQQGVDQPFRAIAALNATQAARFCP